MTTSGMARMRRMLVTGLVGTGLADGAPVDFSYEVRPILSDRCFACHGSDAGQRKKDLRLDRREEALRVIKPGDPAASKLIERIFSDDPDHVMPPPESHLALSAGEREVLRRWIAEGAEYKDHWAFQPIAGLGPDQPVPSESETTMAIDAGVGEKLTEHGLGFTAEAPRERLLRRLRFDLTGLPPTLEEIDAFVADRSATALESVVDRLLASPGFGERMAVDWLDAARYADTFGYQADVASHVWPYRDYVIESFNSGKPFDQFITEQLAGDLLPGATREQRVATAFNRLHRQTNEGGSIEEEFRVEYVCDRVQTFGLAFLGLTLECAKCHDHKFDPVSQRDFYQLFAYFNNIDESGLYSHFTDATPTPTLRLTNREQEAELALKEAAVAKAEAALALARTGRRAAFEKWRPGAGAASAFEISGMVGRFTFDEIKDGRFANSANANEPGIVFDGAAVKPGVSGGALALSGENNVNFALGGAWTRDDPFSFAFHVRTPDVKDRAVILHRSKAWTDAGSCGYELLIEEGRLSAALVHFWPGNAVRVVSRQPLPVDRWTHVALTYDGSSRARGLKLYVDAREAEVDVVRNRLTRDINRGGEKRLTIGQRFRDRGFKGGLIDDFRIFDRALSPWEVRLVHGGATAASEGEIEEYYFAAVDPECRTRREELRAARQARSRVGDPIPELMVMEEMERPKPAFVLFRGAYDQRRERVDPATPGSLPPPPADAPANRLGLARWVTAPENPLTARVIVNRLWQLIFGRGLVATPEDFGMQGQLPSHPRVLDALARRFIASGWDFKSLVRAIVLSRTYRQDSTCSAETRARDPENILLSRGPRFRLHAEAVRDNALACAGLLDRTVGGPSVDPDSANRRSLYTFWKRTMADVRMEVFDMAKREVCVARRQRTNTPLQALTLLNEARFNECARRLAARAVADHPADVEGLVRQIFRTLTSRHPSGEELEVLKRLHEDERAAGSDAAGAATAVALAVMNFDECVVKR